MKIAVIGAGAMGCIYGGHLSLKHEVYLVDTKEEVVAHINQQGLTLHENGEENIYYPKAVTGSQEVGEVDLLIVFVKALYTEEALDKHRHLIGAHTYLMTLQNGSGHEELLAKYVPLERIIIGTTEDNGGVIGLGQIRRGGVGKTNIGQVVVSAGEQLAVIQEAFNSCGFQVQVYENIQQLVWDKLFCNVSLSVVTGVLQVPMGFISQNKHAWNIAERLIDEAVEVAHIMGLEADATSIKEKIFKISEGSLEGITSICADLRNGRRTEVETISGSVVRAAKKYGVSVPTHELMVELVHAMEEK